MSLSKEQIEQIKQQLIDQVNENYPEENKIPMIQYLESLDDLQFEEFLIKNNLIKQGEKQECLFCEILSEKVKSYKIDEDSDSIAILELNPISRGHILIIPKDHQKEISEKSIDFAKKLELRLKRKLNAKKIEIAKSELFGHGILNFIPVYDDKTLEGKRQNAPENILKDLQEELTAPENSKLNKTKEPPKEEEIKEKPKEEIISDKTHWLPRRLP